MDNRRNAVIYARCSTDEHRQDGCRFISRLEGIDSDNELTWNVVRPLFAYFANVFSRNLSEKIKLGIKTQREQGTYRGGRPSKQLDVDRLRAIRLSHPAVGWRTLTKLYNDGLLDKQQVSFTLLRRVYQKLPLAGGGPPLAPPSPPPRGGVTFNGQHATSPN